MIANYSQSNSLPFLWQKIEKLTIATRSDEKHSAAPRGFEPGSFKNQSNALTTDSEATTGTAWEFSLIPAGCAVFFVWPSCHFFYLCRRKKERIWSGHTVVFATLKFTARSSSKYYFAFSSFFSSCLLRSCLLSYFKYFAWRSALLWNLNEQRR